jgi:hypothetical protein
MKSKEEGAACSQSNGDGGSICALLWDGAIYCSRRV